MSRHASRQLAGQFHERLRSARTFAGLTQEQVARKVDSTLRTIQRWEDGTNEPRGSQVVALALIFDVPVADLYPPPDEREAA